GGAAESVAVREWCSPMQVGRVEGASIPLRRTTGHETTRSKTTRSRPVFDRASGHLLWQADVQGNARAGQDGAEFYGDGRDNQRHTESMAGTETRSRQGGPGNSGRDHGGTLGRAQEVA